MKSNLYIKRDIDIINKSISLEHTNDFWHLRSGSSLELTCLDTKRIYSNEEELTKDFNGKIVSYDFENTYEPKVDILKLIQKHKNENIDCHMLVPNYLKKTEAEENLDAKRN